MPKPSQAPTPKNRRKRKYKMKAAIGISLYLLFAGLMVFGAGWMYTVLTRKKRNVLREEHLKSYILEDPKMRDLYLATKKQNPKESGK